MGLALMGCQSQEPADNDQQSAEPEIKDVILATTTSTQDSGLLDVLEPMFEEQTGYNIKTVAVGTGQALSMGEKGEADVLLTHAMAAEKELVDSGAVVNYQLVMHNDFVIVGPPADPAGIKELATAKEALAKIAETGSVFVSRGDDSGTHKQELALWKDAGIEPAGDWYVETGSGMGKTLAVANEKEGYTLTDRATYLAHQQNLESEILLEGDAVLLNIYHVMQVNPEKFEKVNGPGAKAFVEFMIDPATQDVIKEFGVDQYGQPLFFPDAHTTVEELLGQ
ncbi:substrate-binding domain-containing protein [Desulfofalx alkaliphila]|uniref:substrate-binding domain-containing protein n=1 Tax=Desulfofalx alkaliphila TaxID=105483 RepID=UPI000E09DA5F|nr:substrate-binding domain-containing protein [Desulfofalx alkaliphila]